MEKQKRLMVALTFLLALGAVVLLVVSLATDHWVESNPVNVDQNFTELSSAKENYVFFGLFRGERSLNYGFSARMRSLKVSCEASEGVCVYYPDPQSDSALSSEAYIKSMLANRTSEELYQLGLFNYGYWVTVIISCSLSIVFGLISMGFAVFNIWGKPIETITGPQGLYLWNFIGFLFAILEMVIFLILFMTTLKKNYLLKTDIDKFDVESNTNPGYSFYLIPGAAALFLINIILLFFSGYKLRCSFSGEAEKVVDNGMILY